MPELTKPTLILLYAGKDDVGALDAYLHAYNPAFSEHIWAVDIRRKGGDLGQDMLGDEPYSMGGGPNCRTWSILRWFPKPGGPPPVRGRAEQTCELGGPEPSGNGGHGQRQRAHAPTDVPDLAGLPRTRSTNGPAGGLLLPGAPNGPNGVSTSLRSEVLIDLGHTGLHSMGERTPPLPHQV